MKTLKLVAAMLTLTVSSMLGQSNWAFDMAHSKVGFSVTHLVISEVEGQFNEFDGSVVTVNEGFENAKVEFSANIASINTENEQRDNHLKSDDFFNAEKFPKMAFVGKSFKKVDENNYKLVGDLTIRDVTKEVELDVKFNGIVKDPWGNTKAGFKATGMVNRFDYNLKWNKAIETGGLVAGEDVSIILNMQLLKK
jgi:polyisoprenoid-binding protein YceI